MKHVRESELKPPARRARGANSAKAENQLFREILNAMEQGVIFWDAEGKCAFITQKARELLEISEEELAPGAVWKDYIKRSLSKREITAETATSMIESVENRQPFRATRTTRSRRRIMASGRTREDGSIIVSYTDISDIKRNEAALATAKARAESAEAELQAQVARITDEKLRIEDKHRELERLSLIAAHAKDFIVISNSTNHIEWANEAFRRHNGLDLEMDLMGKSARDVLVGDGTDPDALALIDDAIRNRRSITVKLLCYKRDGEPYMMEQEITAVFNDKGEHTNFIMVGRDVTERIMAETQAEEARMFESAKRDESRLLAEFNEWLQSSDSLDELLGVVSAFLEKLLPGSHGAVYVYGEGREMLEAVCSWPIEGVSSQFEPPDCWALRRGRSYFYGANTVDFPCNHVKREHVERIPDEYYCMPIVAHGDTVGLMHISFDEDVQNDREDTQKLAIFCAEQISLAIANVKLREQLREQSTRDPLTGLYNRRYFLDHAKREITRSINNRSSTALLSLDVDHFKKFNDTYGHDAGDTVLKSLAESLKLMFRELDVPCRLGGEEFVVLLPSAPLKVAMERAEALRAAIEANLVRYAGRTLKVTVSIGVSSAPDHGMALDQIMQAADDALYKAKAAGRNQVVAASQEE